MRIVGGEFRGAKLFAPAGNKTRPTSDRVRESLFNILAHGADDFDLENARILDLFAGTGALGLEALSRGAKACIFIDDDADARGIIRRNIEALGLTGKTKVWRRDASKLGNAAKNEIFDLIFADPPYGTGLGQKALEAAHSGGWLSDTGLFVLEEKESEKIITPEGLERVDERSYGDTQIVIFRKA